ncbi:SWIM zinc finger family protein [Halovenus salina]|nr:SWIM zinc finger family protein [Halovenus salina]
MSNEQWPTLTEATIRERARSKSYDRGQSYYERGAVSDVVRRGETVRAEVEGSQYQPYTVTLEFDDAGVAQTDCSCPYDHGGICKHRVAVLLTCLRDPKSVRDKPTISELVDEANRDTLQELVSELADQRPEMADWIEARLSTTEETATDTEISVNTESIRKQANHALPKPGKQGHDDAYAEAERMASELDGLIEQAQQALDAGDSDIALDILEAITEVLATNRWADLLPHDVSQLYETVGTLGETFTEAILMADLDESDCEEWANRLGEWDDNIRRFTGRPTLAVAADAARQGWDDEPLQQALAGNLGDGELDVDEPMYIDGLTTSRLSVLERQERTDEYLNLAKAAGKSQSYVKMLAQEGEIDQTVDTAIETLSRPQPLLEVARTLRENGHPGAAVQVAEHGLTVEGYHRDTLAEWLRDRAVSMNKDDLALRAAITAFEESPSVNTYQAVEELAEDWEGVRANLLASLRRQNPSSGHAAEVFLQEGLYDDAIDVADRSGRSSVIETVVTAVTAERPQWVISTCKSQADPIIEQGKHDNYRTAVRWLRRAGEAAQAADELSEWREYVETIRDDHYQKYKLRPMLEDLLEEF